MPGTLKIMGGKPLEGHTQPLPNKNSILAALPACILTNEDVIYNNVPSSTDVKKLLEMMKLMGAEIDDSNFSSIKINCKNMKSYCVDKQLGETIRSSIMFAGPLIARFGKAEIPVPGGCVLGKRSISAHIDIFSAVGIKTEFLENGYVRFTKSIESLANYKVWQSETSVTATENFLMYTAGHSSEFELMNSACEPHVVDLENLLTRMGTKIDGIGSNRLIIKGSDTLKGTEFTPGPDPIDIAGMIVATALTKGVVKILGGGDYSTSGGMISVFRKFGLTLDVINEKDLLVNGKDSMLEIDLKESGFPLAGENLPKMVPSPWPGFPVDAIPTIVALACKTKGKLLVQNWMYETGLDFIRELNALGANIFMSDPQRVIVEGPVIFKGGKIVSPSIIQACKSLFLVSLADPVETIIEGADILKRRYPDIVSQYNSLGADIVEM